MEVNQIIEHIKKLFNKSYMYLDLINFLHQWKDEWNKLFKTLELKGTQDI